MVGLPLNHVNRRIVALFCILLVLLSALIAVPIAAQEPLPDPTLQAGASGDFPQGSPVFGPADGELVHDPSDDQVVTSYIDFPIANFVAEATFVTPYDDSSVGWSHGFFFRDTADAQLRLIFDSVGNWELTLYTNEEFTTLQSGTISIAETEKGSRNTLRLAADGDSGLFSLNGEIVASLDLSALVGSGDLAIGTGLYTGTELAGAATVYEGFTVWSIGITPTLTPTATPVAALSRAVVGTNRGEIAVGGGETWNYEGAEGERLTIRVVAERPAGRDGTTEERLSQNLLDTYLIVRSPDGEVIAENDDDEDLPDDDINITNSVVSLTLPSNGLYQIEVRSYADESGGAYTLEIQRVRTLTPQRGTATPTPASEGRG
jgi:hypothetical protein